MLEKKKIMKTATITNEKLFAEAAQNAIIKSGWNPHKDLEIKSSDEAKSSDIYRYGYQASKVRLTYQPDLADNLKQVLSLMNNNLPIGRNMAYNSLVASRVYMRVGAFMVSPSYAEDYAEMLEKSSDGLRSAGAAEDEVHDFTIPLTSFFIASVVSGVYGLTGPDPNQFRLGWSLDHLCSSLPHNTSMPSYVAIYVNIQLRLWANSHIPVELLRSSFPFNLDSLEFETERGVAILLDTYDYTGIDRDGLAWTDDETRNLIVDELRYNYPSWPIKAFQFAEMLAPYIISDRNNRQLTRQPASTPRQQPNRQSRSRILDNQERSNLRPSEEARLRWSQLPPLTLPNIHNLINTDAVSCCPIEGLPPDPFSDRFINDQNFRQDVLNGGISLGGNPLKYHINLEAMDTLYRSRATNVNLKSDTIDRPGEALDISHMNREELSDFLPGLNSVDWGATRIQTNGDLQFYLKKLPITDQTSAKFENKGFTDLLLVLDSSGSMGWDPIIGSGPYDSLLRAIYSVFIFLEKSKKAAFMRFAVINFSSVTLETPWYCFAELKKIKKAIFHHQRGGTKLDCHTLRKIADTSKDRFICLMVTDAKIGNATEVVQTVQYLTQKNHRFVLIQIGSQNPMTEQIRLLGEKVGVHVIRDHRQLNDLCLDYTKKHWGD